MHLIWFRGEEGVWGAAMQDKARAGSGWGWAEVGGGAGAGTGAGLDALTLKLSVSNQFPSYCLLPQVCPLLVPLITGLRQHFPLYDTVPPSPPLGTTFLRAGTWVRIPCFCEAE